jgi:hypothetical protein
LFNEGSIVEGIGGGIPLTEAPFAVAMEAAYAPETPADGGNETDGFKLLPTGGLVALDGDIPCFARYIGEPKNACHDSEVESELKFKLDRLEVEKELGE